MTPESNATHRGLRYPPPVFLQRSEMLAVGLKCSSKAASGAMLLSFRTSRFRIPRFSWRAAFGFCRALIWFHC